MWEAEDDASLGHVLVRVEADVLVGVLPNGEGTAPQVEGEGYGLHPLKRNVAEPAPWPEFPWW